MRPLHEFVQTARAIEQGILGVQVQMDKISVRHGGQFTVPPPRHQAAKF